MIVTQVSDKATIPPLDSIWTFLYHFLVGNLVEFYIVTGIEKKSANCKENKLIYLTVLFD